jgi:hypothetical protein
MMGGAWLSKSVADPLEAHGIVLLSNMPPIVLVCVDWCEIRNGAFDAWRKSLAEAAGTDPSRVLLTTIHQHDAPVADLDAEQLLRHHQRPGTVCDPAFHQQAVDRVVRALRASLPKARRVTHFGMGQSVVDKVASNRRYVLPDGSIRFDRMSRSTEPSSINADEDLTDPWLKILSFWENTAAADQPEQLQPVAGISLYAVHPMSYYGKGDISADFPGLARRRFQKETPGTFQMYATGCAGNVVAGKYNDGSNAARLELADRLFQAMTKAWQQTHTLPLQEITFRSVPIRFQPRADPGFSPDQLEEKLRTSPDRFTQCLAAMGLAWRNRLDAGHVVELPCIDLGRAAFLVLPGEAYVEYQLLAQRMRSDDFLLVAGYGEAGTGYIPTEKHIQQKDSNLGDWWWVAPGSEGQLNLAIRSALGLPLPGQPPWRDNLPIVLTKRTLYRKHPQPGVASLVSMFETGPAGQRIEVQALEKESDVPDQPKIRFSSDAGQTWNDFQDLPPTMQHYAGVPVWEGGWTKCWDPDQNQLVELWLRQIQQGAFYHCFTYSRFSRDAGRTWSTPRQLTYERGPRFDPLRPLDPEFIQHNQAYFGTNIFRLKDGTLFTVTAHTHAPSDPLKNQRPWRLGSVPFRGTWDSSLRDYHWQAGTIIEISPDLSSRGLMEPAACQLDDGRLLVVYRGSDTPTSPGRKWFSISTDEGRSLSQPQPWTYDDGTPFLSPSAIHLFLRHSVTGKLYWFGNIATRLPQGNEPRYPLVIAEVDQQTATLRRATLTAMDDRMPWEHPQLQLSNFSILENPRTHDWDIWLTRYFEDPSHVFSADTYHYLVRPR